jgi:hypothetical protein
MLTNTERGTKLPCAYWTTTRIKTNFGILSRIWPDTLNAAFLAAISLLLVVSPNTMIDLSIQSHYISNMLLTILENSQNI